MLQPFLFPLLDGNQAWRRFVIRWTRERLAGPDCGAVGEDPLGDARLVERAIAPGRVERPGALHEHLQIGFPGVAHRTMRLQALARCELCGVAGGESRV